MDQAALFNILLTIISGAVSAAVLMLVNIGKNIREIDLKMSAMAERQRWQEKELEKLDDEIKNLQFRKP